MKGFIGKIDRRQAVLLSLIILAGALLRISQVNYPLDNPDFGRDLLISRHIAFFNEATLLGPANPFLETFKNSPLYYYLLAALVRVWDNAVAVNLANLALQVSIIPIVFLAGKKAFNGRVGLASAAVIAFNPVQISQAAYLWQPHLMSWFVNLALLVFVGAATKKSFRGMLGAAVILATAGAINNAAFALAPAFLAAAYLTFKNWSRLAVVALVLILSSVAYFIPNLIYVLSQPSFGPNFGHSLMPGAILPNLLANLSAFLTSWTGLEMLPAAVVGALLAPVVIWAVKRPGFDQAKLLLIAGAVGSFFLVSSPLRLPWRPDYFTPILSLVAILLAVVWSRLPGNLYKSVFLAILLLFPISKFEPQLPFRDLPKISSAARAIENLISEVRRTDGRGDLNFFRIVYYPGKLKNEIVLSYDAVFWYELERDWQQRLTYLVSSDFGYRGLGSNDYLVLACRQITGDECQGKLADDQSSGRTAFLVGDGTFQKIDHFYQHDGFNFYLMKRY